MRRRCDLTQFLLLNCVFLIPVIAATGAEPTINAAELLRLQKRFPKADANQDGRLTAEEWLAFQESRQLGKEMGEEEARATGAGDVREAQVRPTHEELAYGPLPEQRLNLWITPSDKPTPLIVHIHGGGFIQGAKQSTIGKTLHDKLTTSGVSYASVKYRFQSKTFPLPEVLRGIARSIQFLRYKSGDWNLDRGRIGAFGGSAGGAASAWLGMCDDLADPASADPVLRESSRVQCVWAISVAATMDVWEWPKYNPLFSEKMVRSYLAHWGYDPDTNPDDPQVLVWRRQLRFADLASADDAPMVIFNEHFADNVAHNPHASKALYEICRKAGMDVTLYMREIVNNLDAAPNQFDWMIARLRK